MNTEEAVQQMKADLLNEGLQLAEVDEGDAVGELDEGGTQVPRALLNAQQSAWIENGTVGTPDPVERLTHAGLALIPVETDVEMRQKNLLVRRKYRLVHVGGAFTTIEQSVPFPANLPVKEALDESRHMMMRDLLLLDRPEPFVKVGSFPAEECQ